MDTDTTGRDIGDWVIWGVGEKELKELELLCARGAEGT